MYVVCLVLMLGFVLYYAIVFLKNEAQETKEDKTATVVVNEIVKQLRQRRATEKSIRL